MGQKICNFMEQSPVFLAGILIIGLVCNLLYSLKRGKKGRSAWISLLPAVLWLLVEDICMKASCTLPEQVQMGGTIVFYASLVLTVILALRDGAYGFLNLAGIVPIEYFFYRMTFFYLGLKGSYLLLLAPLGIGIMVLFFQHDHDIELDTSFLDEEDNRGKNGMEYMYVLNEGQVRLQYSHKDYSVDKDCYVDAQGNYYVKDISGNIRKK
ncbi:MAG: hypothetical protein ACOX8H_07045 [Ruminococcus sp.]|jgi:hypothetical protein